MHDSVLNLKISILNHPFCQDLALMQICNKLIELFGIGLDGSLRHFGGICSERVMHSNSCPATIQLDGLVYPIHDLGLRYTCEEAHQVLVGELDHVHVNGSQDLECF